MRREKRLVRKNLKIKPLMNANQRNPFKTKNTYHGDTEYLARPLAATKFEIRISKYETISNDKELNAHNFT